MLLTKKDFKVGQQVACKYAGNLARKNKGYGLGTVSKVGTKLVTVVFSEGSKGIQFILEDKDERDYLFQKTNYLADYELFPSEQAYFDYEEKIEKLGKIKTIVNGFYGNCNLTVDQVRRIYEIIKE